MRAAFSLVLVAACIQAAASFTPLAVRSRASSRVKAANVRMMVGSELVGSAEHLIDGLSTIDLAAALGSAGGDLDARAIAAADNPEVGGLGSSTNHHPNRDSPTDDPPPRPPLSRPTLTRSSGRRRRSSG